MRTVDGAPPTPVVWYFVPPGTPFMGFPHNFLSRNWVSTGQKQNFGVGEQRVDDCPLPWYNGKAPADYVTVVPGQNQVDTLTITNAAVPGSPINVQVYGMNPIYPVLQLSGILGFNGTQAGIASAVAQLLNSDLTFLSVATASASGATVTITHVNQTYTDPTFRVDARVGLLSPFTDSSTLTADGIPRVVTAGEPCGSQDVWLRGAIPGDPLITTDDSGVPVNCPAPIPPTGTPGLPDPIWLLPDCNCCIPPMCGGEAQGCHWSQIAKVLTHWTGGEAQGGAWPAAQYPVMVWTGGQLEGGNWRVPHYPVFVWSGGEEEGGAWPVQESDLGTWSGGEEEGGAWTVTFGPGATAWSGGERAGIAWTVTFGPHAIPWTYGEGTPGTPPTYGFPVAWRPTAPNWTGGEAEGGGWPVHPTWHATWTGGEAEGKSWPVKDSDIGIWTGGEAEGGGWPYTFTASGPDCTSGSATATSITLNKPGGTVSGRMLVMQVGGYCGTTTGTGYTYTGTLAEQAHFLDGTIAVGCAAKIAGASEPATYTATVTRAGIGTGTAGVLCEVPTSQTSILQVSSPGAGSHGATSWAAGSQTYILSGKCWCVIAWFGVPNPTLSIPAGWTTIATQTYGSPPMVLWCGERDVTAGVPVNFGTFTWSGTAHFVSRITFITT